MSTETERRPPTSKLVYLRCRKCNADYVDAISAYTCKCGCTYWQTAAGDDEAAKREFFTGICVALTVIRGFDQGVMWAEIVRSAGDGLIYHAAHVEPEEWEMAGFKQYLWSEMRKRKPRVRAAAAIGEST